MRNILLMIAAAAVLAACGDTEKRLAERAAKLCQYIPDHELRVESRDYMTADFYAVLDTIFNQLPEHEAMDHEWLYYFVTGNGGTIADYTVDNVELTDKTHAVATISVRQVWPDGLAGEDNETEVHRLYMEKVDGRWLISDFDEHKADCIHHIALNRQEQAVRQAISDYLVNEIGEHYLKGELCVPTLMMVYETDEEDSRCSNEEEGDNSTSLYFVWGDFWVYWYNHVGDTLQCVSGGNHSGLMTLIHEDNQYKVLSFEQTEDGAGNQASAQRIFGEHYDVYQNMHANPTVHEAVRREQLGDYVKRNNLKVKYYQDHGWPAVTLL